MVKQNRPLVTNLEEYVNIIGTMKTEKVRSLYVSGQVHSVFFSITAENGLLRSLRRNDAINIREVGYCMQ